MSELETDELCHLMGLTAFDGCKDAQRSGVALARTGAAKFVATWDLNYVSPELVAIQRQAFEAERLRLQDCGWPDDTAYAVSPNVLDLILGLDAVYSTSERQGAALMDAVPEPRESPEPVRKQARNKGRIYIHRFQAIPLKAARGSRTADQIAGKTAAAQRRTQEGQTTTDAAVIGRVPGRRSGRAGSRPVSK